MPQMLLAPLPSFPFPFCDDVDFLMFDNFRGAPSTLSGKSPVVGSGTWDVAANPGRAISGDGYLFFGSGTGIDTAYAQIALGELPGEIGCIFQCAGSPPSNLALSCYPVLNQFSQNNFHFQVGPTGISSQYWMNGIADIAPAWNIDNRYVLLPNEFYTCRLLIDPPYAQGFLFDSTGTLVGYYAVNEPNMAGVIGQFMFVQLYNNGLQYRSVWARKKAGRTALANPSLIRASSVHIGGGVPSGVFSARYDGSIEVQAPAIAATTESAELAIRAETPGYDARLSLSISYPPLALTAATISNSGTGYQPNDLMAVNGGTVRSGGAQAQLRVDGIGPGGAVTAVSVAVAGLYDVPPPSPASVTPITGAGAGAMFTPTLMGTTRLLSSMELTALLEVVFRDVNGNAWLIKPTHNGNPDPASNYPYVPGGVRIGGAAGPFWVSGAGTPEGNVEAPVGALFSRTDGAAGSTLYVKESGAGATGWAAK